MWALLPLPDGAATLNDVCRAGSTGTLSQSNPGVQIGFIRPCPPHSGIDETTRIEEFPCTIKCLWGSKLVDMDRPADRMTLDLRKLSEMVVRRSPCCLSEGSCAPFRVGLPAVLTGKFGKEDDLRSMDTDGRSVKWS
mmetsp:Transcript_70398/g.205902  ORF Transcript_70398/g.205902 Transcript_70398/m.205902 type:complete len:137 (+) Transcript_70398:58-468(+)